MRKVRFGLYVGDRSCGSHFHNDGDELVMDEHDGWSHEVDCYDWEDAFLELSSRLNEREFDGVEDKVFRLVEYPTNEIEDGDKVEL